MTELRCIKFGDMAQQIIIKVNPKDTSLETYVGLEHLDSGSLQINRHGTPKDVIGEKLRVCKGDIIFGKRRVYQKKLAIADFDGICSAHAMVLRPKVDVIDKEFFPFFMQSDRFMERALQISVGSLSPTINWKTLAEQAFTIPLYPEQRRLATTLWAAEDCIVKGERFVSAAERAKQVLISEIFSKGIGNHEYNENKKIGNIPKDWKVVELQTLYKTKIRDFGSFSTTKLIKYCETGIAYLRSENFKNHKLNYDENIQFISKEVHEKLNKSFVLKGNLLFSKIGNIGHADIYDGRFGICNSNATIAKLDINGEKTDVEYLKYFLNSTLSEKQYLKQIISFPPRLNLEMINKFLIPLPPLLEQRQIASILTHCDDTIAAARANVVAAKALKMKMINEMLIPVVE